jgi:undecaprenyl-diphosphatase
MRIILSIVLGAAAIKSCPAAGFPYRLRWEVDAPAGSVCASVFAAGLLLDGNEAVPPWNGVPFDESRVNAFDRWAMQPYSNGLDDAGTAAQLLTMATPAILAASDTGDWMTVGVMYAQSVMLMCGLKNTFKGLVDRNRPYMYFDDPSNEGIESGDRLNSFPSGHAAYAFNGAVFTSRVFTRCFPDSPWKTPVIAGSIGLAVTTAVLRMESGNHFLSDVLAGAAIGGLSGFLIPWLHEVDGPAEGFSVTPLPSGGMVTLRF